MCSALRQLQGDRSYWLSSATIGSVRTWQQYDRTGATGHFLEADVWATSLKVPRHNFRVARR